MYSQTELKELVDKAIINLSFIPETEKLEAPIKYILSMGGKRLRPVLALMTCNLFRDNIDDAIVPALGLEVFHNFTLMHDDIMDKASVRRGFTTVHVKWDISQAVLSGDVMAFIANDCFFQAHSTVMSKAFRAYNKAAIEVCIGQQLDMEFERTSLVTQEEYLRMIELKTAVLFGASGRIGAILSDTNDKNCDLLYEFGKNLGFAFQIQDDLLDVYGDSKVFGKIPGGDITSNKKTYLLVKAMEIASGSQLKKLQGQFQMKEISPEEKIKTVIDIYDQLNIRTITENAANGYIIKSLDYLDKVSADTERKTELNQFALSLVERNK
jgi:geranylgeranyl diphosphate synthase type II